MQLAVLIFKDRLEYQPKEITFENGDTKMEQVEQRVFIGDMFLWAEHILEKEREYLQKSKH